ncbi:GAF domain-containing protein [Plebeiibacterium marinum]|uniref:GAF domain-containing protein n=1 Tax=Plebeiibacterium marinum TaxID=2992111 RepID=A0AAE3SKE4_9BACT|nr:GAF domain-containing protein [Plebeiobacterium marinum]MCW3806423.1 GAF domain-containing protein [Plebeiobacterium marinum]
MRTKIFLQLYTIAAIAFVFALLKYSFWGNLDVSSMYFVFEIVSFIGFLGIIYFSDRQIRACHSARESKEKELECIRLDANEKIEKQNEYIEELLRKSGKKDKIKEEIDVFSKKIKEILKLDKDRTTVAKSLLNFISKNYEIGLGVCYFRSELSGQFTVEGVYGLEREEVVEQFDGNTGMNGQCIEDKKAMVIKDIDEDYFNIESCSGSSKPSFIYLLPILNNENVIGLLELASFKEINIDRHWDLIYRS